jgi:hypothetical protein
MYHAFQAILDATLTDNHLLFSFLYFLRQEDDGATEIDIDVPIKDLFCDSLGDPEFSLAIILFELHHAINIPDAFLDWDQSIRELLRRVATLPKLGREEFADHLEEIITAIQVSSRPN